MFRRARTRAGRIAQRSAIARAYATGWREADDADLAVFIVTVNNDFADRPWADWEVKVSAARSTVTLSTSETIHRATLRAGALQRDGKTWRPITKADVLKFEKRYL